MNKKYKILFVDDNVEFREQYAARLREAGFEVFEAEGDTQAYELIKNDVYDLAILNLMMEYADSGFTLCYHMKKAFPNMPILLCSSINNEMDMAFTLETDEQRAWIKADGFLNKPLRFEQMLSEVEAHLGIAAPNHA